jgi:hypothetical protein
MGINAILNSVDDIPEAMKEFYLENGNKFVLDIDGIDDHPSVRGVITANRTNVKKRDEFKARLSDLESRLAEIPEGFDAEEYLSLKAAADDPDNADRKKAEGEHSRSQRTLYKKKIDNLTRKHRADLEARDGEIAERDRFIDKSVVVTGLKDALMEVGVEPDLLDGALANLRPSVTVQRAESGDRKAIVETDLGDVDVPSFVRDWAQSKGRAYLSKPTGPDAKPGNGSRAGARSMTRNEFETLSPAAQAKIAGEANMVVVD